MHLLENTEIKTLYEKTKSTKKWLQENFPEAFTTPPRPLKIGIHKDIFEKLTLPEAPSKITLRRTLRFYVNSPAYLRTMVVGASRVDLDGNSVSLVTEKDASIAHEALVRYKTKNTKHRKTDRFQDDNKMPPQKSKKQEQVQPVINTPFGQKLQNLLHDAKTSDV